MKSDSVGSGAAMEVSRSVKWMQQSLMRFRAELPPGGETKSIVAQLSSRDLRFSRKD